MSGYISNSSSLKGTRWNFGENLSQSQLSITQPTETIGLKFKVLEIQGVSSYGDAFIIRSTGQV